MDGSDERRADDHRPDDRLVSVFTAGNGPEGLTVKALLESQGITVMSKGEWEGPYRFGPMEILVPESQAADAARILKAARSGAAAIDGDMSGEAGPEA